MKTYEKALPEGYDKINTINFSEDRKDSIGEMICIFTPSLLVIIFGLIFVKVTLVQWLTLLLLIVLIPVYILLHELIHGMIYLIFTGQKFKIGRNNIDFYCILPQIYVYFSTEVLCAAAPLIVFTIILLLGAVISIINHSCLFLVLSGLLGFHFLACRSDMHLVKELMKIKDPQLLIFEDGQGNNIVFKP